MDYNPAKIKFKKKMVNISTPPVSFMTNMNTHIGHLFFTSILDTNARFRTLFLDETVNFPGRAYNLYGKPSQRYMEENQLNIEEFKAFFFEQLRKDWSVRNLNLSSHNILIDDSPVVDKEMQRLFGLLDRHGYLIKKDKTLLFDISKVDKDGIREQILAADIHPKRVKKMLLFHLKNNTKEPLPITRDRWYSSATGLDSEPVAPVFIVSNFMDGYFPNSDTVMACSFNLVLKSILFRMLVHQAAIGEIDVDSLIVYPKFSGIDTKLWDLTRVSQKSVYKDLLRFCLLSQYSLKRQKIVATNAGQKFGIRFSRRLVTLARTLPRITNLKKLEIDQGYIEEMKGYRYLSVLHRLNILLHNATKNRSVNYFSKIVSELSPFMPELTKMIKLAINSKDKDLLLDELGADIDEYQKIIFN